MATHDAIYARMSQDKTGAGLGVDRQVAEIREKFDLPESVPVYADNDISASTGKRRPEYERLVADMLAGRITRVFVWHTDRLWRRPIDLESFLEAADRHKITTRAVQDSDMDLSKPGGRAHVRMGVTMARYEMETKSERQKTANRQRAASGLPYPSGVRLFGYENDGAQVPAEADAIRQVARAILAGRTLASQVRYLNDAGLLTTRAGMRSRVNGQTVTGRWNVQGVRSLLLNPRLAGFIKRDGELLPGAFDPILPEPTWRAVVHKLTDPQRRTNDGTGKTKYLLAGVARCGRCLDDGEDSPMITSYGGRHGGERQVRCYVCREKRHATVDGQSADDYAGKLLQVRLLALYGRGDDEALGYTVIDLAERYGVPIDGSDDILDRSFLASQAEGVDLDALAEREAETTALMESIGLSVAQRKMTLTAAEAATGELQRQLDEIREQRAAAVPNPTLRTLAGARDVLAVWDGLSVDEQRQALRDLATGVVLRSRGRGRRVTPETLRQSIVIEWRGASYVPEILRGPAAADEINRSIAEDE